MIRILYLTTDSRIGGAERTILDVIRRLNQKYFVPCLCTLREGGPLLEQAKKIGLKVYSLEMKSKMDIKAIFRLARLMKEWEIDVLHSHLVHANLLGFLASRWCPVKLFVYTNHSLERLNIFTFGNRLIMRYYNHNVIAVANIIKERLIRKVKVDPAKVFFIPNGIDLEIFKPCPVRVQTFPIIATIANLRPIKGHLYLIKAMVKVVTHYPNAKLILVGEGPLKERLVREIHHLGLDGHIDFLGFRQDIPEILSAADLFVLPSMWETAPLSLLEAMAMGMPIVATRVGGIPEIIEENESGLLVPAGDPAALAQGIMTLLSDRPRAKKMGERARLAVENRFDLKEVVKALEKIYASRGAATDREFL